MMTDSDMGARFYTGHVLGNRIATVLGLHHYRRLVAREGDSHRFHLCLSCGRVIATISAYLDEYETITDAELIGELWERDLVIDPARRNPTTRRIYERAEEKTRRREGIRFD